MNAAPRLVNLPPDDNAARLDFPFTREDFAFLARLVRERAGIVLADHKYHMVYSRLVRRLRALGIGSFREYCALLAAPEGAAEIGFTVNAITTNLTRFFRERHHFDHLRDEHLPYVAAHAPRRRIRIWSAGCSSGEEPYSIAMTMREAMADIDRWDARVLATDLDTETLARGRAGIYGIEEAADIPAPLRARYVESMAGQPEKVRMAEELRRLIVFKHLNLLHDWPMKGPFDAIFCRNVLIYFDRATQAALVERFAAMLAPRGVLYLGHSESLHRLTTRFELMGRTVYRKIA